MSVVETSALIWKDEGSRSLYRGTADGTDAEIKPAKNKKSRIPIRTMKKCGAEPLTNWFQLKPPNENHSLVEIEDCIILEAPEAFRGELGGAEQEDEADHKNAVAPEVDTCERTAEEVDEEHREKGGEPGEVQDSGGDREENAPENETIESDQYAGGTVMLRDQDSRDNDQTERGLRMDTHVGSVDPVDSVTTARVEQSAELDQFIERDGCEPCEKVPPSEDECDCGSGDMNDVYESPCRSLGSGGLIESLPTPLNSAHGGTETSIERGAVECASPPPPLLAPGCSRVSDTPDCCHTPSNRIAHGESEQEPGAPLEDIFQEIALHTQHTPSDFSIEFIAVRDDLSRLKEEAELLPQVRTHDGDGESNLLSSKELNKRAADGRLKHLEEKLKAAGLTDDFPASLKKQVVDKGDYDANQNLVRGVTSDSGVEIKCEFDASKIFSYAGCGDDFYVVYDEREDECGDLSSMPTMGTDSDRKQHNPDRDNLKSLLKKPGGRAAKKNRVIFNENRNEFFDADYIILIREDCEYDEEEDDGVCTCNQHEMVRLTCCEPNCNCNVYEGGGGYAEQTPQSPKFAPPLEFVDAVTLSPPEGYKDMELGEQQLLALQQMARRGQMAAVCRECSQTHEDEGEGSEEEALSEQEDVAEKEKTDQSQQTTPTTPPADNEENNQHCVSESAAMATTNEKRLKEMEEERRESTESPTPSLPPGGSPISGILKGGRLWKQQSVDITAAVKMIEPQQIDITSDDEGGSKRSVRFIESDEEKRDVCDGAPEKPHEEVIPDEEPTIHKGVSPESTEMTLTFKLGNHVLISNNSLKPNSAVRQLFPCTKPLSGKQNEDDKVHHQYLVTAESLRAFEEAKRAKLPQLIESGEADESIKRAIERNTLRRSLIRYEPRSKKSQQKTDNSLVERIKQLTCDVDDPMEEEQARASPPGEEARNSPEVLALKSHDKSFSPSPSSSSSNSSVSSTYKKITDLFAKRERPDIQVVEPTKQIGLAPDLGGPQEFVDAHNTIAKSNSTNEARKQFLSTLAPLTACVSGTVHPDDYYYHTANNQGDRMSMASSVGTEYSLEDIEEGLKKDEEESKRIAPDVLAGTPSASESGDELAMFVQQDASRIERIKKKYLTEEEDDEHDDYGFNRRPSVRGIKPRFGSTTEILQQIQNQIQQPPNGTPPRNPPVAWPYYSETNLSGVDNKRNMNQPNSTYQYAQQYRPTTLLEENIYQNCANQRCTQVTYRSNVNLYSSPVVRVGGGCNEYYQSLPRNRNGRPQSPPPQEVSKGFHQTMVYIPYNHIEGYQPPAPYYDPTYARVTNQNQINKRYIDPSYQEHHYSQKARPPYNVIGRSESPQPGQFSTARSTQTPAPTVSTCTYYPRYRQPPPPNGMMWGEGNYATKINRHSFPSGAPRFSNPDNISLTDSDSQHSSTLPNGYKDSMPNSPTKPRFIERGVPEGAASVSPQDSNLAQSAVTSPTSPQNPQPTTKPLFYAMNV